MINANEVINLIPDEILDQIASDTKVDFKVRKLYGKLLFKLFLFTALSANRVSLRIMELIYASRKFQSLFKIKPGTKVRHSGLGFRLNQIKPEYFKNIYRYLADNYPLAQTVSFGSKRLHVQKLDSTFLTISEKLITYGMQQNKGQKELKFAVRLEDSVPVNVLLFTNQSEITDHTIFPQLLTDRRQKKALNIAVFDRGCEGASQFIQLQKNKISFITRISRVHPKVLKDLPLPKVAQTDTLTILSDQRVEAKNSDTGETGIFRLVTGKSKKTREVIKFLTNVDFLSAIEITELYKSRWEMETFFRFIKQELNFSHLLSRSKNGVTNVMHLTMTAAILLTIYKKTNKLMGWLVAKIKFLDELDTSITEEWQPAIRNEIATGQLRLPLSLTG